MTVLVLGGTTESRKLVERLGEKQIPTIVSVATRYGSERLKQSGLLEADTMEVRQGRLDRNDLRDLVQRNNVSFLVDATHPYAEVISDLTAACADELNRPFIRLERPRVKLPDSGLIRETPSVEDAAEQLSRSGGRVLLTTGTASIDTFTKYIDSERLFARVLPFNRSLNICREASIPSDHIIAMQGPFSTGLNRETYRHYDIDRVVSKRSGPASGLNEKVKAAVSENRPIYLIDRPEPPSANRTFRDLDRLVKWLASET